MSGVVIDISYLKQENGKGEVMSEGEKMLQAIKANLNGRLSKQTDSRQASEDEVSLAWLITSIEWHRQEINRLKRVCDIYEPDSIRIQYLERENLVARHTGKCVFRVSTSGRGSGFMRLVVKMDLERCVKR